jgi:hypothetical protein
MDAWPPVPVSVMMKSRQCADATPGCTHTAAQQQSEQRYISTGRQSTRLLAEDRGTPTDAERQQVRVVVSEHAVGDAVQHAVIDERDGASGPLLCRLEEQTHCAVAGKAIAPLVQQQRRPEAARDVTVMAASMCATRYGGGIRQSGYLVHRQTVHVSSEGDDARSSLHSTTVQQP